MANYSPTDSFIVHILDNAQPDDLTGDEYHIVNIATNMIPRVGDHVHYWLDYPRHQKDGHQCEEMEPIRVTGVVARVEIEYRRLRWDAKRVPPVYTTACIWLDHYIATPPPETK